MSSLLRPLVWVLVVPAALAAQQRPAADTTRGYSPAQCPPCAEWNATSPPVRLYGNVWWVGTRGLSAILITSSAGHVLIDGGLPESAPRILENIRASGFRPGDIRLILNSHAHYDHAGGIAALQKASGARVAASRSSAPVLRRGTSGPDDPQYGILLPYSPVARVAEFADGDTLRLGPLALVAHLTPGHTPGGTSWSWRSCEGEGPGASCLDFVYADSQTPVSADGFLYTKSTTYPAALSDFARGQALLDSLPCDVLLTPHPGASQLWERLEARERGDTSAFRDREGCRRYAATARRAVAERVAREGTGK